MKSPARYGLGAKGGGNFAVRDILTFVSVTSMRCTCPICGDSEISTSIQRDSFTYGSGSAAAVISVDLPVRYCSACEYYYLDAESEEIKHQAVYDYLGVLSLGKPNSRIAPMFLSS